MKRRIYHATLGVLFVVGVLLIIRTLRADETPTTIFFLQPSHPGDVQIGALKLDPDRAPLTDNEYIRCKPTRKTIEVSSKEVEKLDIIILDCGRAGRFEVRGLQWLLDQDGKITLQNKGNQP